MTKKSAYMKSFTGGGMNLDGTLYGTVIPYLEFSIEFQSNQLIYQKEYSKRQQIIYLLIHHLHEREGWGYRKISKMWVNIFIALFFILSNFVKKNN
jgi:hypothetical protein